MRNYRKLILISFLLINVLSVFPQKKVYADYHGIRRTRLNDGDFGEWKYFSQLTNNSTGVKQITYNPDIILPNGRHDIAAVNYPMVGMQSQYDPDYIEYQILSAKSAGIDGFFVEWGYIAHSSNTLLKKIQEVARKYSFEIGVNICDGWLMNKNWHPGTREEKLQYFKTCMQYLIDSVFTGPTAPIVNGKPVFYLFHDGFTESEFNTIRNHAYTYPENYPIKSGNKFPQVIMRTTLSPTLVGNTYTPKSPISQAGTWINNNRVVPTSWIPERIRNAGTTYPGFNRYATTDDCLKYLKAFADNVWRMGYIPTSGFVTPGMNNYGCAGWSSSGSLFIIPRNDGDNYRQLWNYNVQNKNSLNMVYIASWSDYTEGHEIEPTVENGFRELNTTLEYATQFKGGTTYDVSGISQSYDLFLLRKQARFFEQCGIGMETQKAVLDQIARKINEKNYTEASTLISQTKNEFSTINENILKETHLVENSQITITGTQDAENNYILSGSRTGIKINNDELKAKLASNYYEGYLIYEYWDDTWGRNTNIVSATDREPTATFKFIGQVKDKGLKQWMPAKIKLFKENVKYGGEPGQSDISFYGDASQSSKIRNVSFEFTIYTAQNTHVESVIQNKIKAQCKNGILSIYMNGQSATNTLLRIYNMSGQPVYSGKITEDIVRFNISTLAKGVYVVSIKDNNISQNIKIVR